MLLLTAVLPTLLWCSCLLSCSSLQCCLPCCAAPVYWAAPICSATCPAVLLLTTELLLTEVLPTLLCCSWLLSCSSLQCCLPCCAAPVYWAAPICSATCPAGLLLTTELLLPAVLPALLCCSTPAVHPGGSASCRTSCSFPAAASPFRRVQTAWGLLTDPTRFVIRTAAALTSTLSHHNRGRNPW